MAHFDDQTTGRCRLIERPARFAELGRHADDHIRQYFGRTCLVFKRHSKQSARNICRTGSSSRRGLDRDDLWSLSSHDLDLCAEAEAAPLKLCAVGKIIIV